MAYTLRDVIDKLKQFDEITLYVNQKATEALFSESAKEEDRIRRDPVRRTSELLRKVFGSL